MHAFLHNFYIISHNLHDFHVQVSSKCTSLLLHKNMFVVLGLANDLFINS